MSIFSVFPRPEMTSQPRQKLRDGSIDVAAEILSLQKKLSFGSIRLVEAFSELNDLFQDARDVAREPDAQALVNGLSISDLGQLLREPSTWSARDILGVAQKKYSKKTGTTRSLPALSPMSGLLREKFSSLVKSQGPSKMADLIKEGESYAKQSMHEDALECYFEAIGWCRALHGEIDGNHFIGLLERYIQCVNLLSVCYRAEDIDIQTMRFLVKLYNFSSPENRSLAAYPTAQKAADNAFQRQLENGFTRKLIVRVATRARVYKERDFLSDRLLLQLWDAVLEKKALSHCMTEEEYKNYQEVHSDLLTIREKHFLDLKKRSMPERQFNYELPTAMFEDVSRSRYVAGTVSEIDKFSDFVVKRRARGLNTNAETKTSSTLLLLGPTGTGKTDAAMGLAKALGVDMVKVRGVNVRTMWYGDSEKNLKAIFEKAKAYAVTKALPNLVLMFDELDGLARGRQATDAGDNLSSGTDRDLTVLLLNLIEPAALEYRYEKNGAEFRGEIVLVAATNVADTIDKAVLSRFQTKVAMPRWLPHENFKLLESLLQGSVEPRLPKYSAEVSEYLAQHKIPSDPEKVLNTLASSRVQLRSLHSVAESIITDQKAPAGSSRKNTALMIFEKLMTDKKGGTLQPGSLVANSTYSWSVPHAAADGKGKEAKTVDVFSFSVSLAPLTQKWEFFLDLDKHPYVTAFRVEQKECVVVLNGSGAAFMIVKNDSGSGQQFPLAARGCGPGHTSSQNRQKVEQNGFSALSEYIDYRLNEDEALEYSLKTEERKQLYSTESSIFEEIPNAFFTLKFPFFRWKDIVDGAQSFHDAKKAITTYRSGKEEMSLEFFVEWN